MWYEFNVYGYDCFFSDPSEHLLLKTLNSIATEFDQIDCVNAGIKNDSTWSSCINQNIKILRRKKSIHNIEQENTSTILSSPLEDKKIAIIHYATESKLAFWQGAVLAEKIAAKTPSNPPVVMNGSAAISFMAEDKVLYSKFAKKSQCELKPHDQLLHFDLCNETDIDKTIQKISKYPVVIKATNASGGMGALVANNKEHAQLLLATIKNRKYDPNQLKLSDAEKEAIDFWFERTNECDRFCLIQEYVAGKTVYLDDKPYEPTGRLVFYICYINNERHFKVVDGYWKFPRESKNQDQRSVESTISHLIENEGSISNSALIDPATMTIIKDQFEKKVMPLLDHFFRADPTKVLLEMLTGDNILESHYALTELPKLTKSFYGLLEHIDKKFVWKYIFNVLEEISPYRYFDAEIHNIFFQVSEKYSHLEENEKNTFWICFMLF